MLEQPIAINHLKLKNRLVMPPMATSKSGPDGKPTQELIQYYQDKTQTKQIGLVFLEHAYVQPEGKAHAAQMSIAENSDTEELKKIVDAIHQNDAKVFVQLAHGGARGVEVYPGSKQAPSDIEMVIRGKTETAHGMSEAEIQETVQKFTDAAKRAYLAGADGVEIHSAHGYLLNEFYSPVTNHRQDAYGGSLENRIRIHKEIIQSIRDALPADFPISLRLGIADDTPEGSTIQDAVQAAKEFEKAGVDMLSISGSFNGYVRPGHKEAGYYQDYSRPIKQAVNIPVLLTGGITTGLQAEELLQDGAADCIGVGRALLRDSLWPAENMPAVY